MLKHTVGDKTGVITKTFDVIKVTHKTVIEMNYYSDIRRYIIPTSDVILFRFSCFDF